MITTSHPSFKRLLTVGLHQIVKLYGTVGHKVIVTNRCVMKNGQLHLLAVVDVNGELLVIGGHVGFQLGVRLSDLILVHFHDYVGVEGLGRLVKHHGVAHGGGRGLQVHRFADTQLQIPVELHDAFLSKIHA